MSQRNWSEQRFLVFGEQRQLSDQRGFKHLGNRERGQIREVQTFKQSRKWSDQRGLKHFSNRESGQIREVSNILAKEKMVR